MERNTKCHDHVTMDRVRCKLLAVWKTCVQTDLTDRRADGGESGGGVGWRAARRGRGGDG